MTSSLNLRPRTAATTLHDACGEERPCLPSLPASLAPSLHLAIIHCFGGGVRGVPLSSLAIFELESVVVIPSSFLSRFI